MCTEKWMPFPGRKELPSWPGLLFERVQVCIYFYMDLCFQIQANLLGMYLKETTEGVAKMACELSTRMSNYRLFVPVKKLELN